MTSPAPGWYPDQMNPQLLRWWDGRMWTQHAQPNPQAVPPQPQAPSQGGPDPLLTAPALVARRLEEPGLFGDVSWTIEDDRGTRIGTMGKVDGAGGHNQQARVFSGSSQEGMGLSDHHELHNTDGAVVFHVARSVRVKSAARPLFEISLPDGTPVGLMQSEKLFGRTITWGFKDPGGQKIGGFTSKSLTGPFAVTDQHGQQLAQFTRSTEGYSLIRPQPVGPPVGWLVLAAMMAYEIALSGSLGA